MESVITKNQNKINVAKTELGIENNLSIDTSKKSHNKMLGEKQTYNG